MGAVSLFRKRLGVVLGDAADRSARDERTDDRGRVVRDERMKGVSHLHSTAFHSVFFPRFTRAGDNRSGF
jgi:hypothetical protein